MKPVITAFARSPDRGRGLARDMRVRWAFEEVGQPCDVHLLTFAELKEPGHLARHPFGQIPTYEDGAVTLFESGAIILRIAECHAGLLPDDPGARARAIQWMFAALSTIEVPIHERATAVLLEGDRPWTAERLPMIDARIRQRLGQLSAHLAEGDWLEGDFGAGDLMMVAVLRQLKGLPVLAEHPDLAAYVARGEARPAFQRAFAAQFAVFAEASAPG